MLFHGFNVLLQLLHFVPQLLFLEFQVSILIPKVVLLRVFDLLRQFQKLVLELSIFVLEVAELPLALHHHAEMINRIAALQRIGLYILLV